jgi:hypothetical protein
MIVDLRASRDTLGRVPGSVMQEVRQFITDHHRCGRIVVDGKPSPLDTTRPEFRVSVRCACGQTLTRSG